jgi:hypothetical protein
MGAHDELIIVEPFDYNPMNGRFLKGHTPWNHGKKGLNIGGKETQFKKGNIPFNHKPIGWERITKDGYIEIKIKEPRKFALKHRYLWEKKNGAIKKGLILVCKSDDKTNCNPSNWELIDRAEHCKRNRNYPKFSETMKQLWKSERIRERYGLTRKTKLRIK